MLHGQTAVWIPSHPGWLSHAEPLIPKIRLPINLNLVLFSISWLNQVPCLPKNISHTTCLREICASQRIDRHELQDVQRHAVRVQRPDPQLGQGLRRRVPRPSWTRSWWGLVVNKMRYVAIPTKDLQSWKLRNDEEIIWKLWEHIIELLEMFLYIFGDC
jgi:hypothetical protein